MSKYNRKKRGNCERNWRFLVVFIFLISVFLRQFSAIIVLRGEFPYMIKITKISRLIFNSTNSNRPGYDGVRSQKRSFSNDVFLIFLENQKSLTIQQNAYGLIINIQDIQTEKMAQDPECIITIQDPRLGFLVHFFRFECPKYQLSMMHLEFLLSNS